MALKLLNTGRKNNDFSVHFETFDGTLLNIANDGNWKSCLNLLYNDRKVAKGLK